MSGNARRRISLLQKTHGSTLEKQWACQISAPAKSPCVACDGQSVAKWTPPDAPDFRLADVLASC
jgi:hypothetical protein